MWLDQETMMAVMAEKLLYNAPVLYFQLAEVGRVTEICQEKVEMAAVVITEEVEEVEEVVELEE